MRVTKEHSFALLRVKLAVQTVVDISHGKGKVFGTVATELVSVYRYATHDCINMWLDRHSQILWNTTERVRPSGSGLSRNDLHVVVVLAVDDRNETECTWVHVAFCILALLRESIHTVKAHQEMAESIITIERVEVLHERRAVLFGSIDDGLRKCFVGQEAPHELLVVSSSGNQAAAKIGANSPVEAVTHAKRLQQVLI